MTGEKKEHWMELCERAAIEQDPQKMLESISEINRLLQEKEDRLTRLRTAPDENKFQT